MTMQRWDWQEEESWPAPLDVLESPEKVTLHAVAPSVNPDNLQVTIVNRLLSSDGESEQESEETDGDYQLRERQFGSVYRNVRLLDSVNANKAETKKAKRLHVQVKGSKEANPQMVEGRSEAERKGGQRAA